MFVIFLELFGLRGFEKVNSTQRERSRSVGRITAIHAEIQGGIERSVGKKKKKKPKRG